MVKLKKLFVLLLNLVLFAGLNSFFTVFATERSADELADEYAVEQIKGLVDEYNAKSKGIADARAEWMRDKNDSKMNTLCMLIETRNKIRDNLSSAVVEFYKSKNKPTSDKIALLLPSGVAQNVMALQEKEKEYARRHEEEMKRIMAQSKEELLSNSLWNEDELKKMIEEGSKEKNTVGMLWIHTYTLDTKKNRWIEQKPMLCTATLCDLTNFALDKDSENKTIVSCSHTFEKENELIGDLDTETVMEGIERTKIDSNGFFTVRDKDGKERLKVKMFYVPWSENLQKSTRFSEEGQDGAIPVEKIVFGHDAANKPNIDVSLLRLKTSLPEGVPLLLEPADLYEGEFVSDEGTLNGFGMGYRKYDGFPHPKYDETIKAEVTGLGELSVIINKNLYEAFDKQIMLTGWQKPKKRYPQRQLILGLLSEKEKGSRFFNGHNFRSDENVVESDNDGLQIGYSDSGSVLVTKNHGAFILRTATHAVPLTTPLVQDMWRRLYNTEK